MRFSLLVGAAVMMTVPRAGHAQSTPAKGDSARTPPLFRTSAPLAVTLTANMKQLRGDKSETSPYRTATVSYVAADGKTVTVPIRVKTHGIWRLKHCEFPPLRLNVSNKESKGTLFHDLQHPKVTSSCRDNEQYEQYVLQELQLYRIYQTLTPASHHVRAMHVTYVDSASAKPIATRYAFLFEDPDEMADRLGGKITKAKGAGPDDIDASQASLAFLFEYFIGNSDFSFSAQHNAELVSPSDGSLAIPVAYDFDFSGAVNAVYATTDPKLPIRRVRDRLYRGYCSLAPERAAAIARFQERKAAIYALYQDEVGKLMKPDIVKETLEYFDDFYRAIKDPKDAERNVFNSCLGQR
jgi:hypothetical protein